MIVSAKISSIFFWIPDNVLFVLHIDLHVTVNVTETKWFLLSSFPCLDCNGMNMERKWSASRHEFLEKRGKHQPILCVYPAVPDLDQVLGGGSVPVQFPSCVVELQQALNAGYEKVPEDYSVTHAAIPL